MAEWADVDEGWGDVSEYKDIVDDQGVPREMHKDTAEARNLMPISPKPMPKPSSSYWGGVDHPRNRVMAQNEKLLANAKSAAPDSEFELAKKVKEMPYLAQMLSELGDESRSMTLGSMATLLAAPLASATGLDRDQTTDLLDKIINETKSPEARAVNTYGKPGTSFLGKIPLYIASSALAEKRIGDTASKLGGKAKEGVTRALNKSGLFQKSLSRAKKRENLGGEKVPDQWDDIGKTLVAATGLSTVESTIDPNDEAYKGALFGGASHLTGKKFSPMFSKTLDANRSYERELIDGAKDSGFIVSPGVEKGQFALQKMESDMATSNRYGNQMSARNLHNDNVAQSLIMKEIGMEDYKMGNITPEAIQDHQKRLVAEYENIEANTKGWVNPDGAKNVRAKLDSVPEADKAKVSFYLDQLDAFAQQKKVGEFKSFDGNEYKRLRMDLNNAAKDAKLNNSSKAGELISDMVNVLDDGVEAGITKFSKGTPKENAASAAEWKDLRERYALSQVVIDNGINRQRRLDVNSLADHFMGKDRKRYLSYGAGERMNKIYKTVDEHSAVNRYDPHAISGLGSESKDIEQRIPFTGDPSKQGPTLISTSRAYKVPLLSSAAQKLYFSPLSPSRHGIMRMQDKNQVYSAPKLLRAGASAQEDLDDTISNQSKQAYQALLEQIQKLKQRGGI